jgi:hypothetical protein
VGGFSTSLSTSPLVLSSGAISWAESDVAAVKTIIMARLIEFTIVTCFWVEICDATRREKQKPGGSLGSDIAQINFFLLGMSASQARDFTVRDYDFSSLFYL